MATKFRTCRWCGKIFQSISSQYCDQCLKDFDKKFVLIRDYLYEYPNATVVEVVENTGVEENLVFHFLKEGRLEMKSASGWIRCEKCGKPISSGRLCDSCKNAMSQVLNRAIASNRTKSAAQKTPAAGRSPGQGFKSDLTRGAKD